jgi:hypothetical protein
LEIELLFLGLKPFPSHHYHQFWSIPFNFDLSSANLLKISYFGQVNFLCSHFILWLYLKAS